MAVNLKKGQKVDLTKGNPGLSKIMVGLGWDVNRYDGGHDFDLDASAFLLGANGKVANDSNFVFYSNPADPSGAVRYGGDNRTGAGEGDDETIFVDLATVPANVEKIDFTVTIYDAAERRQNFGQVSNAYVRVVDESTGMELIRYDLEEDFSIETAMLLRVVVPVSSILYLRRLLLRKSTATTVNGSSMPSAAASRADSKHSASTSA